MKKYFLTFSLLISFTVFAQVKTPQPSPFAKIEQTVGLTHVTLEYSRPSAKDRIVFGNLVPWDKLWRTGANASTKVTFSDDVVIDGKTLSKGTYAIYSIPGQAFWDVFFYKDIENNGLPQKWDESKIALYTKMDMEEFPIPVETFTILFGDLTNDSASLTFIWDEFYGKLTFNVPTKQITLASIEATMNGGNPTPTDYYLAAAYYYQSEMFLEQALTWINKAIELDKEPKYWVYRQKSLIQADLGDYKNAIATAEKSLELAEKAGNTDYVKLNKDSIEEWAN